MFTDAEPVAESDECVFVDAEPASDEPATSVAECLATMLNGTLGPGMLVLPLAFARTGLAAGVCACLAIWALSYLALLLLLEACHARGGASVSQLAREHGPWMARLTHWSMLLFFFGNCAAGQDEPRVSCAPEGPITTSECKVPR